MVLCSWQGKEVEAKKGEGVVNWRPRRRVGRGGAGACGTQGGSTKAEVWF